MSNDDKKQDNLGTQNQETSGPEEKKKRCKKICKIVLILLGVFLVVEIILAIITWPAFKKDMERKRAFQNEVTQIENAWKNDTYGGDTPEETYNLFADAVRKKDIDLALKYVAVSEREWIKKFFDEKISENKLDDFIENDLPLLEKMTKEIKNDTIRLKYLKEEPAKILNDDGKTTRDGSITIAHYIELVQNTYTNKWKIVNP